MLADAVWSFLERALDELVPERDVPVSRALCHRIVDEWPTDEEGWAAARESLARALCEKLVERPQIWARAIHIVGLYLDHIELDVPHPQKTDTEASRRGQRVYFVDFGLPRALMAALLGESTPETRAHLYEALDEWDSWRAVAGALAEIPLSFDPDEISLLMTRAFRFSGGDGAADELFDMLLEGFRASTQSVDDLLETWFERMDLEPAIIDRLAEWRLPRRCDGGELRKRMVHQVLRLPPGRWAPLALRIAYRSWAADAAFECRRAALMECLDHLGTEGLLPALIAVSHDRNTQPDQDIALYDAIVALIDDARQLDPALAAQRVELLRGVIRKDRTPDVSALVARLPPAAAFPAEQHRLRLLDWLLSRLAAREAAPVQDYLLDWIEAQAGAVRLQGLRQFLPSTYKQLPGARWLIEAATSRRPALRVGALGCLIHAQRPVPSDFAALRETQVLALAHMLLAEAALGAAIVDLLFILARARADCITVLTPLLGDEALRIYPGQYRRNVASWATAVEPRTDDDVERPTVIHLQSLLKARQQLSMAKHTLVESIFERTSPTRRPTEDWLARAVHQELSESNDLFLQLATKVPVACGAGWAFDRGEMAPSAPQPFKEVISEVEVPILGGYDPVAAAYFGYMHRQEADRLLNADEEQPQ